MRVDLSTGPATGRAVARGEGVDRIVWRPRIGVVGSRWDDRLVGSDQRDYLVGVEGDDTLEGGRANDLLYPDRADSAPGDAFPSSGGNDVVVGGRGNDLLKTFEGRDNVRGGAGEDVISVEGGVGDVVAGDKGADLLVAYFTGTARGLDRIELDGGADPGQRDVVRLVGRGLTKGTVVSLDARSGTVLTKAGGPDRAGTVEGFDEYRFDGRLLWRFVGSQGRDQVRVDSGRLRAWGTGGPDILQGGPEPRPHVRRTTATTTWAGVPSGDILRGDGGRDHLVGNAGIDTCRTGERLEAASGRAGPHLLVEERFDGGDHVCHHGQGRGLRAGQVQAVVGGRDLHDVRAESTGHLAVPQRVGGATDDQAGRRAGLHRIDEDARIEPATPVRTGVSHTAGRSRRAATGLASVPRDLAKSTGLTSRSTPSSTASTRDSTIAGAPASSATGSGCPGQCSTSTRAPLASAASQQ